MSAGALPMFSAVPIGEALAYGVMTVVLVALIGAIWGRRRRRP